MVLACDPAKAVNGTQQVGFGLVPALLKHQQRTQPQRTVEGVEMVATQHPGLPRERLANVALGLLEPTLFLEQLAVGAQGVQRDRVVVAGFQKAAPGATVAPEERVAPGESSN